MEAEELITAMKHGSLTPEGKRTLEGLGRFGPVLKTQFFSQWTGLTVVTSQNGSRSCAKSNVDWTEEKYDWLTCGRARTRRVVQSHITPVFEYTGTSIVPPPMAIDFRRPRHRKPE